MRDEERRKLDLFHMKFLIRIDENTRTDVIGNEDVRNRTDVVGTLEGRVDLRVLRGFGFTERMDAGRLHKRVMKAEVIALRLSARPRYGWMDSVKQEFGRRNTNVEQVREPARYKC